MQRFYFVLFLVSICFFPLFSHAQTPGSIDSIEIRVTPENPSPKQLTTIKVESFLTDLNKATISWAVDGKTTLQGVGETSFSLNAPANSKKSIITILIRTIEGREVRRTIALHPGDISITWEALGYVPPLFSGKALPTYQGEVKFVAIPDLYTTNGTYIDPETLIYTWKKGSTVLGSLSGYGKQSLIVAGGIIPEPLRISVEVQSKDGKIGGEASLAIDFYDPEIEFYKEDPLYGILYNHAFNRQEPLTNNELKIVGVPYNFTDSGSLSYMWSINNVDRTDLENQRSVTFRSKGETEGTSVVSLEIRNAKNILQSIKNNFTVYFSKQNIQ